MHLTMCHTVPLFDSDTPHWEKPLDYCFFRIWKFLNDRDDRRRGLTPPTVGARNPKYEHQIPDKGVHKNTAQPESYHKWALLCCLSAQIFFSMFNWHLKSILIDIKLLGLELFITRTHPQIKHYYWCWTAWTFLFVFRDNEIIRLNIQYCFHIVDFFISDWQHISKYFISSVKVGFSLISKPSLIFCV